MARLSGPLKRRWHLWFHHRRDTDELLFNRNQTFVSFSSFLALFKSVHQLSQFAALQNWHLFFFIRCKSLFCRIIKWCVIDDVTNKVPWSPLSLWLGLDSRVNAPPWVGRGRFNEPLEGGHVCEAFLQNALFREPGIYHAGEKPPRSCRLHQKLFDHSWTAQSALKTLIVYKKFCLYQNKEIKGC